MIETARLCKTAIDQSLSEISLGMQINPTVREIGMGM